MIISCYNEEHTILQVIDEVSAVLPQAHIAVFDNNSTDSSKSLVLGRIQMLANSANIDGGGGTYQSFIESSAPESKNKVPKTQDFAAKINVESKRAESKRLDSASLDSPANDTTLFNATSITPTSINPASIIPTSINSVSTIMPNGGRLSLFSTTTQGKGAVIADAFALLDADIYVMIDGDTQYDTAFLPQALAHFCQNQLDMLNIARATINDSVHRKGHSFGNKLLSTAAAIFFGKNFGDMLSGYRIFSRAFVKSFPAQSKGFEIETELSVFALQQNLRVDEIEAPYKSRPEGSFSKLHTFRDGFRILFMIFQLLFTERPLLVFGFLSVLSFAVSLIIGVDIFMEFLETSRVARFPTLFVCVGLGVIGVVLGVAGMLAHLVVKGSKEARRMAYLNHKKIL
ncbi:hypothetical protein BKN38_05450 [Helicobacter sp. CLO-3]|nr:hypothetical protein BKN38_05450 [Helicobacter sp. CLO-3]